MADAPTTHARTCAPGADRLLCASAWLEPLFGRYLFRELFHPGLSASAPAYGVDLVLLARHTLAARRHRAAVIGLAVAMVLFALVTLMFAVPLVPLVLPLLMVVLVGGHLYVIRERASRIITGPESPDEGVLPLRPWVEHRLRAAEDSNVVVFHGGAPFAGAGRPLEDWTIRVEATRAASDRHGNPKVVLPVGAEQLQKELTLAIRAAEIPDAEAHNRLLVGGHHARTVDGLVPDPLEPPLTRLDPGEIRRRIEGGTEFARTYLCVRKDSWHGELVVNCFIRVVPLAGALFVGFSASVLLPVHPGLAQAERMAASAPGRLSAVLRDVVPHTIRLVRESPRWTWEVCRWRWRLYRRPARQRRLIRQRPSFDYGAGDSIRTRVAAARHEWQFAYEDEDLFVQAIRGLVLSTVITYADDHGLDTTELERQRSLLAVRSLRIADLPGRDVAHGDQPRSDDFAVWADQDWFDAPTDHDDLPHG